LKVVTDLLVTHLEGLVEAWAEDDEDNYRAELLAADPDNAFQRIVTGVIVLSGFETGRERLTPALATGEQEDEHSCFSDNTHRDMVQDVRGMQNAFLGRYKKLDGSTVSGPSVHDVIEAADAELAEAIKDQIAESLSLAEDLQAPFDQEIKPDNEQGNARVEALINALADLEGHLEDAFDLFGFEVPAVE
jgi:putative iron-regulated protein